MKNRNKIFTALVSLALFLNACAPAATPAPIASQPAEEEYQAPASTEAPAVVEAPAPTQALASDWQQPEPIEAAPNLIQAAPPPVDNYFQDYGVNPFVDPYEDNLSTFALDGDTASYTVARRYVTDGNLPPADAVRVEEFVNYFKQDYPTPAEVAFGVYADGAPSPFQADGSLILRFGVQGYSIPDEARKPAVLTFVIDISGSMEREQRLKLVKKSLKLLVKQLHPTDSVAIVVYGSEARIVLYPTSGEDSATILSAISSLQTEGATNAEAGLQLGYQLAYQAFLPGANNRVILCSDGVANVGKTGPDGILASIRGYAS